MFCFNTFTLLLRLTCHLIFTIFGKTVSMKKISITSLFLLFTVFCMAHPWKPSHYVIVDTDGGIDDMKALCMLLASPDVRLLAVTVSDGILSEDAAYKNVREMLDAFHHEGVTVVRGGGACALIAQSLKNETTPVTFIALGSLRTAATAMNTIPEFRTKIKQIIWSNDGLPGTRGYNYRIAPEAAERIINDTISLLVTGSGGENFYDDNTAKAIAAINSRYAEK